MRIKIQMCVGGCGMQETNDHLFLNCGFFGQVWEMVLKWLGVYTTFPSNTLEHFVQFGSAAGYAKTRRSFMNIIWFATSWVI